ncbi:MAG TPA: hypothetical protein VEY70_18415 [Metabacillus sp.]|nr:hypothetical protein [Metabacillus sp.]
MSKKGNELKILLDAKLQLNTKEEIQQKIKEIVEKFDKLEVNFNFSQHLSLETISKFIESRNKLKTTLNKLYPSLDADKFIDFVVSSPLRSNHLDFKTLLNLFNLFEDFSSLKYIHSDLNASITVRQSLTQEETINKEWYLKFIINVVFPIFAFLLTQYQNMQTTEQLNRIESKINKYIEQQNELEDVQKIIIELPNDFSGGTRL